MARTFGECEHEWGEEKIAHYGGGHKKLGNGGLKDFGSGNPSQGQFCKKCNAWRGSLGLEPTPELYIQHIVQIFREVKRVLRKDGVCFLNIGDSYWGSGGASGQASSHTNLGKTRTDRYYASEGLSQGKKHSSLKPKDLCMIPARVALALQADGWWVRSPIIWFKPNPMPESVKGWRWEKHRVKIANGPKTTTEWNQRGGISKHCEPEWQACPGCPKCTPNDGYVLMKGSWRPTSSYEHVFLLTKSDNYFCDQEAVKEEANPEIQRDKAVKAGIADGNVFNGDRRQNYEKTRHKVSNRNLRNVWTIATEPTPEAHFATFPSKLVETCIKAGTSEKGCCPECGSPWVRVVEKPQIPRDDVYGGSKFKNKEDNYSHKRLQMMVKAGRKAGLDHDNPILPSKTIGWRRTCKCRPSDTEEPHSHPCTVLDIFSGSGKTLIMAKKLERKSIGIELSPEYCEMPLKKLAQERMF